jgi:hypothetical protein
VPRSFFVVLVTFFVSASVAAASELIDRNVTGIQLLVNSKGEALLNYTVAGKPKHVLVWGPPNAIAPTRNREQLAFQLDFTGGWGKYYVGDPKVRELRSRYKAIRNTRGYLTSPTVKELSAMSSFARNYWQASFRGSCAKYDGPRLAWFVTGCKAPDGSYWAVQSWQRMLPNYGIAPNAAQAVREVRLSHWTGALPVLTISTDWAWHRWDHLYGTFTYAKTRVYGFKSTRTGVPLDTFGRNVYVDTLDSVYGSGWKRENSFLTHSRTGVFCYSVNPHGARPSGKGAKYRATIIGPGLTPDVMWEGASAGAYDRAADAIANAAIARLNDRLCRPN